MAELVVAAAGAAAGGYAISGGILTAAGSLTLGAQLGWLGGTLLASSMSKGQVRPQLQDLRVTGTGYGAPIPFFIGSIREGGVLLWASEKRPIKKTQRVGKGGSKVTSFTYEVDLFYMVSEQVIEDGISWVAKNGELVFDGVNAKSGTWSEMRVYTGAADQMPDPTYEAAIGEGFAPAHRGRGTVMLVGVQLDESGQIPNFTFKPNSQQQPEPDSDVLIMLRFDEAVGTTAIVDSSIYNRTVTNLTPADTEISSGGAYLNQLHHEGATQLGGIAFDLGSDFTAIGAGPFTVDASLEFAASGGCFFDSGFLRMNWNGGTSLQYIVYDGAGVESGTRTLPTALTTDTRYRMRIVRDGDSFTVTFNDIVAFDLTVSEVSTGFTSSGQFKFGGTQDPFWPNVPCHAKFDEIRVSRGVQPAGQAYPLPVETPLNAGEPNYGTARLIDAVRILLERCGMTDDEFDISALEDVEERVRGFYLSQIVTTRQALEMLAVRHRLVFFKTAKLHVLQRKSEADGTVDWDDLGMSESGGVVDNPFPVKQANPIERPAQVFLRYRNLSADFEPGMAQSDQLLTGQKAVSPVDLPMGLYPSEAQGVVDSMLRDQLASLLQYGPFRLPMTYAEYMPTSVLNIPDHHGVLHRVRLTKRTDMGIMIEFEGEGDDPAALIEDGVATDDNQGQTEIEQISTTRGIAGDWPLLRDSDDAPGYYMAAASALDGDYWPGAQADRSWDDVSYALLAEFNTQATLGDCITTLPDFTGGNVFDESSTLTVEMTGELSSSTKTAMIGDLTINVMMVGVECIRFRIATFLGMVDGRYQYRLAGLIRGFRGTEWAIGTHGADEVCCLLDAAVYNIPTQTNQINLQRYHKFVTFGLSLADVDSETFTDTGVRLKPWSVACLTALGNEDGDVVLTWDRRTRKSYSYGGASGVVAPLGEAFERYRIRVYDGVTQVGDTHEVEDVRTFTYTAAMASADGFSSTDAATFEVVQLSEIVGEGYPAEVEGTIP